MSVTTTVDKLRIKEIEEQIEAGKVLVLSEGNIVKWVTEDKITPDMSAYYTKEEIDALLDDLPTYTAGEGLDLVGDEFSISEEILDKIEEGGQVVKLDNGAYQFKDNVNSVEPYAIDFSTGNDASVMQGGSSTALGYEAYAEGLYSTALGANAEADGSKSAALGLNAKAEGYGTTALGTNAYAEGRYSTALGRNAEADGSGSTALGQNAKAEGYGTTALGANAYAEGQYSTALGRKAEADGSSSTALGYEANAEGYSSTAIGTRSTAYSFQEVNLGSRPTEYTPQSTTGWDEADRLFNVAGGDVNLESYADYLTILKSGKASLPETKIEDITDDKDIVTVEKLNAEIDNAKTTHFPIVVSNGLDFLQEMKYLAFRSSFKGALTNIIVTLFESGNDKVEVELTTGSEINTIVLGSNATFYNLVLEEEISINRQDIIATEVMRDGNGAKGLVVDLIFKEVE